ncbi:hypothetical protein F6X40_09785 [Paraburkholderia sp. UCT31]|uniref:hypothetical protein n=1 Tax=Paraburkholderia sp. UCT31 TaxID=2615209 RepID=UPI001654E8F0|nr:hypothetical protein [Paraburkholderia sp. UCT31]MBC8737098.1 hypothetical protein [Paraburkholderia sp. UCT31]
MSTKYVICPEIGGFFLSKAAIKRIFELDPCNPNIDVWPAESPWEDEDDWEHQRFLVSQGVRITHGVWVLRSHASDASARSNPVLLRVVEELGARVAGEHQPLSIVEALDDSAVTVFIDDDTGREWLVTSRTAAN